MLELRFPPPWSVEEQDGAQNYGRVPTDSALNQE
jgi:hypothetical protein